MVRVEWLTELVPQTFIISLSGSTENPKSYFEIFDLAFLTHMWWKAKLNIDGKTKLYVYVYIYI